MQTPHARFSSPRLRPGAARLRPGFTLVELLVVIAIIGTLVALLLPAVQAARNTARQTECLNQVKQLGLGMQSYETSKGQLPGYIQSVKRSDQSFVRMFYSTVQNNWTFISTTTAPESRVSWVTMLLPNMDGQAMWDNIIDGRIDDDGDERALLRPMEQLSCPSDLGLTSLTDFAGTSYSANSGGWDLDNGTYLPLSQANNTGDTKANGIFQNLVAENIKVRLSGLKSSSGTIMVGENQHKVVDNNDEGYTWFGVAPVVGVSATQGLYGEQQLGLVWVAQFDQPIVTSSNPNDDYHQAAFNSDEPTPDDYQVDRPLYARPNANHSGGVFNVVFADGHGQSINPDIDYTVYQRLLTTDQRKCVDPKSHTTTGTGTAIFEYRRLAPLVQADYE